MTERDLKRERDIVKRRLAGETLAAIGASYGISRERTRVIFNRGATDDERERALKMRAPKPKPERRRASAGEAVQILLPSSVIEALNGEHQDTIRHAVGAVISEPRALADPWPEKINDYRINLTLPKGHRDRFARICKRSGLSLSAGVRAAISEVAGQ